MLLFAGIAARFPVDAGVLVQLVKDQPEISSWNNPLVVQVRGKGLMIGVQIKEGVKPFDIEVD